MGTGNGTETSFAKGKAHFGVNRFPGALHARNLKKSQLGGVIFGCKNDTMRECLLKQIFGLPAQHFSFVKNIDPGLPLFLFNCSDRKLHGIYEAASPGKMNINPYGWTADGSEKTMFPAQVQIRIRMQCQPLLESQFRPIIADNYYDDHHFWFELDHGQANKLMSLLASLAIAPGTSVRQKTVKWKTVFQAIPSKGTREQCEELSPLDIEADLLKQSSQKSDSTDGENQPLEVQPEANVVDQEEKEYVYMKLRDMALKTESHSENHSLSFPADGENNAPKHDTCVEGKDYSQKAIMGRVENASMNNEILSKFKGNPGESSSSSVKDHCGQAPGPSPDYSVVTQLIQEVEELKTFKREQTRKTGLLEEKLVRAETEIQLLKRRLVLQSEANPSAVLDAKADEVFDELDLDSKESIFLLGGYDGESWLSDFGLYYPSRNVLRFLRPMNSARSYASVAQLNGELYVLGGGNGHDWYDTVESYFLAKDQWTVCPSLSKEKGSLAGAAIDDKIFAMGGGNGVECFSNVEMLDLDVGRWINTRSMLQKRFSLAAVELNGVIYATGGFDGNAYLKSAEMFDPREHSWTKISSMNTRRGCHSLVVLNEKLYAVGGFDGDEMVPTVEIYDPRLGSWMFGEPMNFSRGYSVSAVVNETIYVFGGLKDGSNIVNEVESFKEGRGWKLTAGCGIWNRCFHSAIASSP